MFEEKITSRGFKLLSFVDSYDNECSVQESSCVEPRLWLGVNDADPKILAFDAMAAGINTNGQTTGWIKLNLADEISFTTRMHLTQEQAERLIPVLQKFVETGRL